MFATLATTVDRMVNGPLLGRVASLATNDAARTKLKDRGLNIATVAWEDTSRYENSSIGSNISDMTLKVESTRMPIVRAPNFADITVDLPADKLPLLVVGNEAGLDLKKITLQEYLENFSDYCGTPCSTLNLHLERDSHVLTSAQACILPIESGSVEFAVDLFNYQSGSEPAVLVIMATAYGTSAQVVAGGNTLLYFNDKGTSRLFKAERLTDHRESTGSTNTGAITSEEKSLNGIYIFQIPLHIERSRSHQSFGYFGGEECIQKCSFSKKSCSLGSMKERGMERAVLKVGEEKGPYKGIKNSAGNPYEMKRDTERPIRLTVQFYMCTDSDTITNDNVDEISQQIRQIYDLGLNEGSLVTDSSKPGMAKEDPRPTATTTETTTTTTTATPTLSAYVNNSILG